MFNNRVICAVCLFLLCSLRIAGGTVMPSNIAVIAGNWMAMECRPNNGSRVFKWELKRSTSSGLVTVFRNYNRKRELTSNFSSRFGVDMDESCSGLVYTNTTQIDDAGLYVCRIEEPIQTQLEFSAHLTVLESEPVCETNYTSEDNATLIEGDIIWMQCTVNFRGMWAPSVEWKQHTVNYKGEEDDQQRVLHGVPTVTLLNISITSTLIFVADFSKTTYFSYRLFFQWYNGSVRAKATNLPSYTYAWKSPRLVPHWAQLKTTEQVYVAAPLPIEVGLFSTTVTKPNGNNNWYIMALLLLVAVLIFVSLLVGLGIRRHVRLRRARDINMVYNASTSSAIPLRRLDRPSSGEYDLTPTATPNIYDRIDGADADGDVTAQAMASQNQCDPQQCYSGLSVAIANYSSPYDTLDLYEKMDPLSSETDQTESKMPEGSILVSKEERYTTPVPKKGLTKPNNPGSSNYLEMTGAKKKSTVSVAPTYGASSNDSDEDNYPDGKAKAAFAKDCDDYLQPDL